MPFREVHEQDFHHLGATGRRVGTTTLELHHACAGPCPLTRPLVLRRCHSPGPHRIQVSARVRETSLSFGFTSSQRRTTFSWGSRFSTQRLHIVVVMVRKCGIRFRAAVPSSLTQSYTIVKKKNKYKGRSIYLLNHRSPIIDAKSFQLWKELRDGIE